MYRLSKRKYEHAFDDYSYNVMDVKNLNYKYLLNRTIQKIIVLSLILSEELRSI